MGVVRIRQAGKLEPPWQLRIELLDVKPLVWRRLRVPANITLPKLHRVFQAALGWTNGLHYAEPNPEWAEELAQADELRVVLSKALGREFRSFDYVYDYGDSWYHLVVVEDYRLEPTADSAVLCLGGENACPPEDVGGAPGYADFLAAIADPRHEEHQNYMAWCGGSFDPGRFDREAVNVALSRVRV